MNNHPFLYYLEDTGEFPNSELPVILYKRAIRLPFLFKGLHIKKLFASHGWSNAWNSGVYTYNHYHSITHEVLGFFKGSATILLGGNEGRQVQVSVGDVLIIPAGVAHRNLANEHAVECIGAYPDGRDYDINTGKPGERPATDQRIGMVPIPAYDPLYGEGQGVAKTWITSRKYR